MRGDAQGRGAGPLQGASAGGRQQPATLDLVSPPPEKETGRPALVAAGLRRQQPLSWRPFRTLRNRQWPQVRKQVYERAQGHCDMCGFILGEQWECHHRKLRSQGGKDDLSNLLALGPRCHERAHLNRAVARRHGWIVLPTDDPAAVPVRMVDGYWLLDDEGGRSACPEPEGAA